MSKTAAGLVLIAFIPLTLLLLVVLGMSHDHIMAAYSGILVVAIIGCAIGFATGRLLSQDTDVDGRLYRAIAWSNLVLWIVPAVGITMSAITYEFHKKSYATARTYRALSLIGAILASAYAGISGVEAFNRHSALALAVESSAAPMELHATPANTQRSTERCPFAAQEGWSHADAVKYCWVRK